MTPLKFYSIIAVLLLVLYGIYHLLPVFLTIDQAVAISTKLFVWACIGGIIIALENIRQSMSRD